MATQRIAGKDAESKRNPGPSLTLTNVATLRNGPRSLLVRFLPGDAGDVDLTNYDVEVAPYERFSWTVTSASVFVAVTSAPDGDMRHWRMATSAWRCAVVEEAP